MTAYNHEKFIREAIEGVIKQKTYFSIELLIHDDASTDNTASIIDEYAHKYPNIIKPLFEKENMQSQGKQDIFTDNMIKAAKGRYIALCEGDDYWTDAHKLQKQYDFLEAHHDYSMTMHNAWELDMSTGEKALLNTFPASGYYPLDTQVKTGLGSKFPATASYFFRKDILDTYPKDFRKGVVGDYFLRVYNASKGRIYYFDEPMSVYRYRSDGSFTQKVTNDPEYYSKYIRKIIGKYNLIDKCLKYQFHEVYRKVIASNILGYLASGVTDEDVDDFDVKSDFIVKCRRHLDEDYLEPEMAEYSKKIEPVWIYGISNIGKIYLYKLLKHGINVKGFVVSDGHTRPESFENKKVSYLSEVVRSDSSALFIIATQPINADSIIEGLQKANITNYIYPLMDLED